MGMITRNKTAAGYENSELQEAVMIILRKLSQTVQRDAPFHHWARTIQETGGGPRLTGGDAEKGGVCGVPKAQGGTPRHGKHCI